MALIENGFQKKLYHGNLNSVRTLIDVRDAMHAYWISVLYCKFGEAYNIGGTTTMTVGEYLEKLISLSNTDIPTMENPNLLRPADVTLQIPSVEKFVEKTSWQPKYSFEESLEFLLNYWRNKINKLYPEA